jgi:hypothetical protein
MKSFKGSKKLLALAAAVSLVAVLAVPMTVLAAPGDVVVTGTMPAIVVELTAPSAITIADSLYGTTGTADGSSATAGTVLCTNPAGYTLTLVSDKADGIMESSTHFLGAALMVTSTLTVNGATPGAPITTPAAQVTGVAVTSGTPLDVGGTSAPAPELDGINDIAVSVTQAKSTTAVAGTYTLTLTFTATAK